jgi:hypothetical protein
VIKGETLIRYRLISKERISKITYKGTEKVNPKRAIGKSHEKEPLKQPLKEPSKRAIKRAVKKSR